MPVGRQYSKREYRIGHLTVAPLTPVIGAVVTGLDLREPVGDRDRAAVRIALKRHKVLFFREQVLTSDGLVAFGRTFGTLQSYTPAVPPLHQANGERQDVSPHIHTFDYGESQRGREAFWHFDVLPDHRPARAGILRARVVPHVGGDTLFCDLGSVYDSLPDANKARLEHALAVYDLCFQRRLARFRGKAESDVMAMSDEPLVRLPTVLRRSNGRRVLFVNPAFLVGIEDMSADEARAIGDDIRRRIDRPDFQCRFRWEANDVAFWDNRACLHYATNNYWPARRVMDRVTLIDDWDGRESTDVAL